MASTPAVTSARVVLPPNGWIEVLDDVLVAGGEPRLHRAWPAAEVLPDGDLLVAYKESRDHNRTDDATILVARSSDGGRTWPFRRAVVAEPGWGCITSHGLTRLSDGTLLLPVIRERHISSSLSSSGPGQAGAATRREIRVSFARSDDGGQVWQSGGPFLRCPGLRETYTAVYGRVRELRDGRLLVPVFGVPVDERDDRRRGIGMAFSADGGYTWDDFVPLYSDRRGDVDPSETDVVRLADGRLLAMIRANAAQRLYQSYSADEGRNWTPLQAADLPGQCPCLFTLASGALLCAYRDMRSGQPGLGCAVSEDLGATWAVLGALYRGTNRDCAYPSLVRLSDGRLFCANYDAPEPAYTGPCDIRGLLLRDRSTVTGLEPVS